MIKYQVSLHVQNLNVILIIGLGNPKLSEKGTTNVAIYAFFSGKFLNVTKYACVKDLTNIMSMPNTLLLPQFQPIMVKSLRFPISIHLVGFIQQWIRIFHSHDEKSKHSQTLSMPFLWRCRCRWCRTTNPPFVTPYSTGH